MKIFTKTVELTEAQIEGLYSGGAVALAIVAPPPSGYAAVPVAAQIWKTAGNAATAGTSNIVLSYGTATTAIMTFTSVDASGGALGNNAQSRVQHAVVTATNGVVAGGAINISSSAAIAAATGTKMKISIDYKIVKL